MNQQTLIECIKNPALVKPEHLPFLEDLEQKHPHFPAIKVLKLKILKDTNDLSFSEYLKEVALLVPDRSLLYKVLLREQVKARIEESLEASTVEEPVIQNSPEVAPEKTIEEVLRDIKKMDLHSAEELAETSEDLKPDSAGSNPTPVQETDTTESADNSQQIEPTPSIEQVNTDVLETSHTDDPETSVDQLTDAVLDELIKPGSHTLYQIEKVFGIQETDSDQIKQEEVKNTSSQNKSKTQPNTFLDWLEPDKVENNHPSSTEIIDRFIQNKPRISKFDKEKTVSEKVFKIVDKDDIVTETLARIYIKQKNYQKAIEIYQKLSLNIPEKKGYFASQIHFLEELIKKD